MRKHNTNEYFRVILTSLFGGISGSIPFLALVFFKGLTASPFYLLAGIASYLFCIYFNKEYSSNKKNIIFVILGLLISVTLTQIIGFAFDPAFTKQITGNKPIYEKSAIILINNYKILLLAILIYFIIALVGLVATYVIVKVTGVNDTNGRNKKNARKKH